MIASSIPGDIVNKEGANGTAIVRPSNGPKVLLPRGVPNLQFYYLLLHLHRLGCELNTDGHVMLCVDLLLDELLHHAGLADALSREGSTSVADHDELEKVVETCSVHLFKVSYKDGEGVTEGKVLTGWNILIRMGKSARRLSCVGVGCRRRSGWAGARI